VRENTQIMGMNFNNRKSSRRSRHAPMAEINVTPMVDVMLVLLIVFMVAAPLMTVGVPVDLPKAEAPAINEQTEPLVVSIDGNGKLYIQETPIATKDLIPRLRAITKNKSEQRIFVRGDKKISYGRVMEVMANLSAAGFTKVALIAETPDR
jgi:biopolymer transport protein TolR